MILPKYITLKNFAASLVIDFPNDNVSILQSDKDWKKFGALLIQENSFSNNGAPGPGLYKNPDKWAVALFNSMASFA